MLSMRSLRAQAPRAVPLRATRGLCVSARKAQPKPFSPALAPCHHHLSATRRSLACPALSWASPETVDHSGIGQIAGIQSFVASLKDRRSHVPPEYFKNPLQRIFQRFDDDSDGYLTAKQVHLALAGNGIDVTEAQVDTFLRAADLQLPQLQLVSFGEFEAVVYTMAEVDLANNGLYVNW